MNTEIQLIPAHKERGAPRWAFPKKKGRRVANLGPFPQLSKPGAAPDSGAAMLPIISGAWL